MRLGEFTLSRQTSFWWIVGLHGGKPVLLGPKLTEEDAERIGMEKLEGDYKVVELPTKNESKATRLIKARRLHEGLGLGKALEKTLHSVPMASRDDDL